MSSHYDCIGIRGEAEAFRVIEAIAAGEGRTRADGGVSIVDRDDSGATVAVHLSSAGELVCATPSFAARPRGRVVPLEFREDPDCAFCSVVAAEVVDEDDETYLQFMMQLEEPDLVRGRLEERPVSAAIAAFGDEISVWSDPDAYAAAQAGEEMRFAVESFFPMGMFLEDEPPRRRLWRRSRPRPGGADLARAFLTGVVERTDSRTNTRTGGAFLWAEVRILGMTIEMVAAQDDLGLSTGAVVQGQFWLVGRLAEL